MKGNYTKLQDSGDAKHTNIEIQPNRTVTIQIPQTHQA